MDYRGVEYEVSSGDRPATWRWTVRFDSQREATGQIIGKREHAIVAVRKIVDKALQPQKSNSPSNHADRIEAIRAL